MKPTNISFTDTHTERLRGRAAKEGVSVAQPIRRAVDAFLACNNRTHTP